LRKGFTLAVTMMMLVIISSLVVGLWASTRDDVLIAGNARRIKVATMSAESGIHHFMSLNLFADDLREMSGGRNTFPVIPEQRIPDTRQFYDVRVSFCCDQSGQLLTDQKYFVISDGYYKSGGKVASKTTIRALVQTR
jgi:hypothetical protein